MKTIRTFNTGQTLFSESAWLLFNNRQRILSNPLMAYAPTDMPNGRTYSGGKAFEGTTIGAYLEWWQECEEAVVTDLNGRRNLIVCFDSNPLSGRTLCRMVNEDNQVSEVDMTGFSSLWHSFSNICHRYADREKTEDAYCLEEVVCRLTGRLEDCMKFIVERINKCR